MPPLRVAVVGSGPAGVYAAAALTDRDEVAVDVIDWLPKLFGLVRYRLPPDREKMKSVAVASRKVLEQPGAVPRQC
jgi:ferredoxin/flavodoxin---NADP+ reductase